MTALTQTYNFTQNTNDNVLPFSEKIVPTNSGNFKTCKLLASSEKADIKKINDTLKKWKDVISKRANASKVLLRNLHRDDSQRMELEEDGESDRKTKDSYFTVINNIQGYTQNLAQKKPVDANLRLQLLFDDNEILQAAALYRVKPEGLISISNIASAPWNIPMQMKNKEKYEVLRVKQAGSSLIRKIYEDSQKDQMKRIQLTPLENSLRFYKYIGMTPVDSTEGSYEYIIGKDLPWELLKSSKPTVELDRK